jgi:eukaryotic-like serine/threonine-protein kinase
MQLKQQLIDLLTNWPDIDNSYQRRDFLERYVLQTLTNQINLEGSRRTFSVNLLGTIQEEDKVILLIFLNNLISSDQIGQKNKNEIEELRNSIAALNSKQWGQFKGSKYYTKSNQNQKDPRTRNIQSLHDKAIDYWIKSILNSSLQYKGDVPDLNIQLKELPNAVKQKPGFDKSNYNPQQISNEDIADVFDEIGVGKSLLILGEPGFGKTTILLKLLKQLIDDFDKDQDRLLPVLFHLSSWTERQENFDDWLVNELKIQYKISPEYGIKFIQKQELILLLDGFDEINVKYRIKCIQKLNDFIDKYGLTEIVMCSRMKEYEDVLNCNLIQENEASPCNELFKLNLQKAFYIQPLEVEEIERYLNLVNKSITPIKKLLRKFSKLRNPLILFVIIKADIDIQELPQTNSSDKFFNYLLDKYVELMLERRSEANKNAYPEYSNKHKQTKYWLHCLARKLKEIPSEESTFQGNMFQIERIQPNWLPSESYKLIYRTITGLIVGLLLGLTAGFYFIYYCELAKDIWPPAQAITNTLKLKLIIVGVLPGLISGLISGLIQSLLFSRNKLIRGSVSGAIFALFLFLTFQLLESQLLNSYISPIYLAGILGGAGFSLIRSEIQPVEIWQIQWKQILKYALIFGVFGILYVVTRFRFLPQVYEAKGYYYGVYEIIPFIIVGAVFGGLKIKKDFLDPKQGEPNQGIKRSVRYTVLSLTIFTIYGIIHALIIDSVRNPVLIFLSLTLGLFGGLAANQGSGIVCIQHYTLRCILSKIGYIPWKYEHFLDYTIDRVLLRKSGSGYLFIHGKLLEYFAKMKI